MTAHTLIEEQVIPRQLLAFARSALGRGDTSIAFLLHRVRIHSRISGPHGLVLLVGALADEAARLARTIAAPVVVHLANSNQAKYFKLLFK